MSEETMVKTEENNNPDALMEIDVQMTEKILYDYRLYHVYHGLSGILATMLGLLMVVYYFEYHVSPIYLACGLIVIFYLPCSLSMSVKQQMLMNPAFKEPLHYVFTDEGIEVSQNDAKDKMGWDNILKAVSTSKSIILYTTKINATIIPRSACDGQVADLIGIIATHVPPKKVKIRQ